MEKIYLTQIGKYIEKLTGIPQQIIDSNSKDIAYLDFTADENYDYQIALRHNPLHMVLIVDSDITVNQIVWSGEYGLGLNIYHPSNINGYKAHIILWADDELEYDDLGYSITEQMIIGYCLDINIPKDGDNYHRIELTKEIIQEIKSC